VFHKKKRPPLNEGKKKRLKQYSLKKSTSFLENLGGSGKRSQKKNEKSLQKNESRQQAGTWLKKILAREDEKKPQFEKGKRLDSRKEFRGKDGTGCIESAVSEKAPAAERLPKEKKNPGGRRKKRVVA